MAQLLLTMELILTALSDFHMGKFLIVTVSQLV